MAVQVGDKVSTPGGMTGEVAELDDDGVTALVAMSDGIVGRFDISVLERVDVGGDELFTPN